MINAQDIKNGTCIRMDGRLYFCVEFLHVKPGKGNTFMRTKLKDVVDGRVLERRFNIGEKLEDVRVERRPFQYLYTDGDDDIFMNNETFEQIPIKKELVTGAAFMKEGDTVEVVTDASTETVLFAEMPIKTILKITYTEPGLKGDTATNTLKPASPSSSTRESSSRSTPATAPTSAASRPDRTTDESYRAVFQKQRFLKHRPAYIPTAIHAHIHLTTIIPHPK